MKMVRRVRQRTQHPSGVRALGVRRSRLVGSSSRRGERGTIAVALLVVIVVGLIAGAIAATVAWQSATVTTDMRAFAAQNMAANAVTAGREAISTVDPRANPTFAGLPTSEPTWTPGWQDNQQYRWWVDPGAVPSEVTVTGQGRAGVGSAAVQEYSLTLRYDYNTARWVPQVLRNP